MVFITLSALYQYKQCTQFRLNWYHGFREKATNVQKFTNDVRRTPTEKQIGIRRLIDSDDLKRKKIIFWFFFFYFIPVNIKSINTYFINGSQIFLKSCLHIYLTYQNSLYSDTGHWSAHILLLRISAKVPQKLLLSFFFNFPTNYIEAQRSMFHLKEQMSFFL